LTSQLRGYKLIWPFGLTSDRKPADTRMRWSRADSGLIRRQGTLKGQDFLNRTHIY